MPIDMIGSNGAWFVVLGKLGALIKNLNSFQNTQVIAMTSQATGVVGQLDAESDIQAIMGNSYIGLASNDGGYGSVSQQIASSYLNRLCFRDGAILNQTLNSQNPLGSIAVLINQMQQQGYTVLAMTVTGTPVVVSTPGPHFVGTGNGIINVSTKRAFDGRTVENAFSETLNFIVTSDSYTGGQTAGNEPISVTGAGSQSNFFAFDWPLGSNCSIQVQAINGNANNSQGNILTNSGMNNWTSNVPDNWTLVSGVAGTNIQQETSLVYDGAASMRIIGDGTTNFNLTQTFGSSAGTLGTLSPQTQYSFCCFMRRDGTIPASGVLTIDLIDTATNLTINDQAGVANSFAIDLTALGTGWGAQVLNVRTPIIMPSSYKWRMRLTTALTSGRSVYWDKGSLSAMTPLGPSLPYVAVHAGSIPFIQGDRGQATITNSRGAGGTNSTMQTLFARMFPQLVYSNGILLPSSSVPNVSDSLIS